MRNWRQGAARPIERRLTGFEVTLDSGNASPRGTSSWPSELRINFICLNGRWFEAQDEHASVHHIFESGFHREQIGPQESVVLIGLGSLPLSWRSRWSRKARDAVS